MIGWRELMIIIRRIGRDRVMMFLKEEWEGGLRRHVDNACIDINAFNTLGSSRILLRAVMLIRFMIMIPCGYVQLDWMF